MRIAMFSDNFYPELGGIQDSLVMLAKFLGQRGHTIKIYVPKAASKDFALSNVPLSELDLGPNITIERSISFPYDTAVEQTRLVIPTGHCYFSLKKFNPDIIHTHTFFGMGFEAWWGAKWLGIPLIGTNHTAVTEFVKYSPLPENFSKKHSLKYVSWYYNHCNMVSAPSECVFTEMKANGFTKPSKVISNPIDTNTFFRTDEKTQQMLKQKFHLSPHTFVFAGRFSPEKNIDILVRALAEVKKEIGDVVLALAGHGSEQYNLEQLALELSVQENVKFFGTLSKSELNQLYQASDVFAISSTCETQGLVMMQAFATGLPVVGVRARALEEYINEQNGFLVDTGDFEALAKKIVLLFKDKALRTRLGTDGFHFVQQFSTPQVVTAWEEVYTQYSKKGSF